MNQQTIAQHPRRGIKLEQGQSVLELMLALLVLIPLLIGGIELSRGVGIRQALDSGTHIASRALSLEPGEWSWATDTIQSSLDTNILGGGSVSSPTVRIYNTSGTQITPTALNGLPFGSQFRLEAEVTYTPDIPLVGGQTISIRVSHWSIVERYP